MTRKKYLVIAFVMLAFVMLAGCSKDTSTYAVEYKSGAVSIKEDGTIEVTYREEFDEKKYDYQELERCAKEEINEFNSQYSQDNGMAYKSLLVRHNRAKLVVTFATPEDYILYNKIYVDSERVVKLFVGTYAEAVQAGYEPGNKLYKVTGEKMKKKAIKKSEIENLQNMKVVYITKGTNVEVDGKIKYVNKNVSFIKQDDEYIAETSDMSQNFIIYEK